LKVKSAIIANGLQTIIELAEKPMPVSLAAKLLRLVENLQKENEIIEKQRRLIIEKYADKDEKGEVIISNEGNVSFKENKTAEEAQNELNELANLEVEIIDRGITEEELINSNIQLTLGQLSVLKNFIKEDK
jgi:ArsR family metal-binding transcriptional regulator